MKKEPRSDERFVTRCAIADNILRYSFRLDRPDLSKRPKKEDALIEAMNGRLPNYMRPNRYIRVRQMPYNANGKIDRKYLKGNYNQL